MFSEHTALMVQELVAAGMSQRQANIIGDTMGQCLSKLTHRGAMEFFGPMKITGPVKGGSGGGSTTNLLFDGRSGAAYFNINNVTGTLPQGVLNNSGDRIFSIYTLAADLNAGDSVTVGDKTFVNSFCRAGYKLVDTTVVGGINGGGGNFYIVAADKCEQPQ